MTSYPNQKINICVNFGLRNWLFEFTIVINDIKYFLCGTNLFFPSFSGIKYLWSRSYVGGCVVSDVEVVESFVRYAISGISGMFRGTLTPT